MDKLLAVDELRLSRFGECLFRQRLIKPGSDRYYVIWVRKFLTRPVQVPITSLEDRMAVPHPSSTGSLQKTLPSINQPLAAPDRDGR